MTRVPGVGAVAPLLAVALAIVLPLWLVTSSAISLARQEDDVAPVEAGAGPIREQSLGFTGRNVYSGESVELFGYLTAVIGLERDLLFADAAPSLADRALHLRGQRRDRIPHRPRRYHHDRRRGRPAHLSAPERCRRRVLGRSRFVCRWRAGRRIFDPPPRYAAAAGARCRRPRRRRAADAGDGRGVLTRWRALPLRGGRDRAAPALRRVPARQ